MSKEDDLRIRKLRWLDKTLKELQSKSLPKTIDIPGGKVIDVPLFIESHANTIRHVEVIRIYSPFVDRLEILRKTLI